MDWEELERLAERDDVHDRAFANGVRRLAWAAAGPEARTRLSALEVQARRFALATHAGVRAAIAAGTLRGDALRARIEEVDPAARDHWIEELLDVVDPPLAEASPAREMIAYVPSAIDDVLFALDATGLGPASSLVDLGAGMGKVVLLASLLTGAAARGIEIDPELVTRARRAAQGLGLPVRFDTGDARTAELGAADVYYLFVPFTGEVLATVLARLEHVARTRPIRVCASALDLERWPWLRRAPPLDGARQSAWLVVHES